MGLSEGQEITLKNIKTSKEILNSSCIDASVREPMPHGKGRDIATLVQQDIERRAQVGERKYKERLLPHNGRNALMDAYQEALDLCMYLRQLLEEQEDAHE